MTDEERREYYRNYHKQYRKKHKEKILQYDRKYRKQCKEKSEKSERKILTKEERKEYRKKYNKKYYQEHRKETIKKSRDWAQNNKKRVCKIVKQYQKNHIEKYDEYQKQWREENREYTIKYNLEHKEYFREYFEIYSPYYRLTHKKGNNIMKTHWTEQLEKIDKQIAKLNQLRESIIEATSEPEEEQIEPTIDRYGFKKNERRVYYDLPEYQEVRDYRNMNHVPLEGASNYELYENGELFSRKEGRFVDGIIANNSGDVIWKVIGDDGTIIDIWRKMEMKKCFPEFKEKIKSRHGLQYS